MSTRRARIKAVASLPVRRKNNEVNKDLKPNKIEEIVTKESEVVTSNAIQEVVEETVSEVKGGVQLGSPRFGRKIHTPNLVERTPGTPKSKKLNPRYSSPLTIHSPLRQALSPAHKSTHPESPKVSETPVDNVSLSKDSHTLDGITQVDYNPPSIPESVTEDTVLDGIVPLQSRNIVIPLDILKSEIISETAEALFDPIVPLPSPSKVRPKLRPAPRLPVRRNSIQGSASESEDESKRALLSVGSMTPGLPRQRHDSHTSHITQPVSSSSRDASRIRNDSLCSTATAGHTPAPPPAGSRGQNKPRRTDSARRLAAVRRRGRREPVPREALTMFDLIFYNPLTNPIVPEDDAPEEVVTKAERGAEAKVERGEGVKDETDAAAADAAAAPVPQIKLGPNGEIILDEKSLVIEQTESKRQLSDSVIRESAATRGGRYTRPKRAHDWSDAETVRFYRALAAVGTDFTLMQPLFPDRSRRDLKVKFKKEERNNGAQVDRSLRAPVQWDALRLQAEFAAERRAAAARAAAVRAQAAAARRVERERARANKDAGARKSKGSKALECSRDEDFTPKNLSGTFTPDEIIQRAIDKDAYMKRLRGKRTASPAPAAPATPKYATLTLFNSKNKTPQRAPRDAAELATISKVTPRTDRPVPPLAPLHRVPKNIEDGSLVVLTVNDPADPTKKMLQTYISRGNGSLTPVALPPALLGSVVTYMKGAPGKGTPVPSPQVPSPASVGSDGRSSVIQINPSPVKKARHNSYTITTL